MNAKKNPKQDLERKRGTVFTIGLLAAGSFTLAAFTYVSPVESAEAEIVSNNSTVEYYVESTKQEEPEIIKPETPTDNQTQQESTTTLISEVSEDIIVTESSDEVVKSDAAINGLTIKHGDFNIIIEKKEVEAEFIEIPDIDAEFMNGYMEMVRYIQGNIEYPEDAIALGIEGKVHVEFVVQKDGTITNVKIAKGVHRSLDREAARIVRSFPKWIPAEHAGRIVASRVIVPIDFKLK